MARRDTYRSLLGRGSLRAEALLEMVIGFDDVLLSVQNEANKRYMDGGDTAEGHLVRSIVKDRREMLGAIIPAEREVGWTPTGPLLVINTAVQLGSGMGGCSVSLGLDTNKQISGIAGQTDNEDCQGEEVME